MGHPCACLSASVVRAGISAVEYADRVVAVFNQTAIEIYGSVEACVQAYKESISYVDVPRQVGAEFMCDAIRYTDAHTHTHAPSPTPESTVLRR